MDEDYYEAFCEEEWPENEEEWPEETEENVEEESMEYIKEKPKELSEIKITIGN